MNKTCISLIVCLATIFLACCAPSSQAIQTAHAQTQISMPTIILINTPEPISTLTTTERPTNTALPEADKTIEAIIHFDIADMLEKLGDVETVTTVRAGSESLEIELRTQLASQDRQPDVSYKAIRMLAIVFGGASEDKALLFVAGNPQHFSILLTTYSVDGNYKYSSLTYCDILVKFNNKQITYDEWVKESGAGFMK